MLVLRQKLHICTYDQQFFFLVTPLQRPLAPTDPQSGGARTAHTDYWVILGTTQKVIVGIVQLMQLISRVVLEASGGSNPQSVSWCRHCRRGVY